MSAPSCDPTERIQALPMLAPMPAIDFSVYGPVESVKLTRQQRLVGNFLARNWAQIPHVTHHDEARVDALEALRGRLTSRLGVKVTQVPLIVKALVLALKTFPRFNASIDEERGELVLKRYFHVGVAVETPQGLLVPVIRDCDRKDVATIASELADKAARARTKGLPIDEMSGGCISISVLGGIGGTGFTPIVNAPEVAVLGVSRTAGRVVLKDGELRTVTMLPLSLSYDHRVINGADAARFCRYVAELLEEPERLLAGIEEES